MPNTVLFVQGANQVAPGSGDNIKAFASNNRAGNCIVIDVSIPWGSSFGPGHVLVTDSNGNTYTQVVPNQSPGLFVWYMCFVALNIAGGANTVQLHVGTGLFGTRPFFSGMAIHEYSGVASASALDVFAVNMTAGAGAGALPLSLTTTAAGDLLHAFAGDTATAAETYSNTGGWALREMLPFTTGSFSSPQMASFDFGAEAAGAYANTIDITITGALPLLPAAIVIALKANSTFNGWNIISLPTTPSAPATIDFTATDIVAMSISPFTGQQQVHDWQQGMLEASVSYPPMTHVHAQAWIAFLLGLRGQRNVFQFGDPLAVAPQGSGAGTPLVNGGPQSGFSLNTKGWTAGASGVLLPGDWLQIGYRAYRNLLPVNADGSGNATINIYPSLRESPADGDALILNNTKGLWRLKTNARKWSETAARVYGIQFDFREAL